MFKKHPKEVGMTYFEHMKFALKFSFCFFRLSITSFIHAIFPFLFVTNASRFIKEAHMKIEDRKECECCCCKDDKCEDHSDCCCNKCKCNECACGKKQ